MSAYGRCGITVLVLLVMACSSTKTGGEGSLFDPVSPAPVCSVSVEGKLGTPPAAPIVIGSTSIKILVFNMSPGIYHGYDYTYSVQSMDPFLWAFQSTHQYVLVLHTMTGMVLPTVQPFRMVLYRTNGKP